MKKFYILLLLFLICYLHAKTGLVLSGGGARSLAHIGVLKVLDENDIKIDCIVGTSMGAVIAALYAIGYSGIEIEELILGLDWSELSDEGISRKNLYAGDKRWAPMYNIRFYLDDDCKLQMPRSIKRGYKITELLFRISFPASSFTDFDKFPIPFRAVAANLETGQLHVFSEGNLHEVLKAASSFPTILPPFRLDNNYYVDGGILENIPAKTAAEMGADNIIAVKTTAPLKTGEEVVSVLNVLEQSMNIAMTKKLNLSLKLCDVVIEPELDNTELLDFDKAEQIILAGEKAARDMLPQLRQFALKQTKTVKLSAMPYTLMFTRINVSGNNHLSGAKIREYTELETNWPYSLDDITLAMRKAYQTGLFRSIYPVISKSDEGYMLLIKVEEEWRRNIGLNVRYNDVDDLIFGVNATFTNISQKNSRLIVNLDIGGRRELNLDYVKNFGELFGGYLRLFPYIREDRLFLYDASHHRTGSVKLFEKGTTAGVGMFFARQLNFEGFLYHYHKNTYRDIMATAMSDEKFSTAGIGLKLNYEDIDDFVFPVQGLHLLIKYNAAQKGRMSDTGYQRLYTRNRFLYPITFWASVKYQLEYGTYFKKAQIDFDPFYIGGIDSYLGFQPREFSAPFYNIHTLAVRLSPFANIFIDLQLNSAKFGNVDYWEPEKQNEWGGGIKLGYKSYFGPVRAAIGFNKDHEPLGYLSVGWDIDSFEFSRK
ncbi:MAG: patatin-like phospholipase family protein [Candidatus Cloacimonetes bacterium]|nr:patatin-like phospholipase family protein [Candidatus Cloacimonadota bacterium]